MAVPTYSKSETLRHLDIPPTLDPPNLGPLVKHFNCSRSGVAKEVFSAQLDFPEAFIAQLMRFGAIYYCPVHPKPGRNSMSVDQAQLDAYHGLHRRGIDLHGRDPRLQVPERLLDPEAAVAAGGYVRAHLHPRRFPRAHCVTWAARVLVNAPDYVAVNKPWGVQVPHTADNVLESVVACVSRVIGHPQDLLPVHRLDNGTEGVVVLAKHAAFARAFSSAQRTGSAQMCKVYRALTALPPPPGPLRHWAVTNQRRKGWPAFTRIERRGTEGSVACELVVQRVKHIALTGEARQLWGPKAYESEIRLVTGRTHQIRAQLAAIGLPLLGDVMYESLLESGDLGAGCTTDGTMALWGLATFDGDSEWGAACAAVGDERGGAPGLQAGTSGSNGDAGARGDAPAQLGVEGAGGQRHWGATSEMEVRGAACETASQTDGAGTAAGGGGGDADAATEAEERGAGLPAWLHRVRAAQQREGPIALQAAQLTVLDSDVLGPPPFTLDAGPPWWRA